MVILVLAAFTLLSYFIQLKEDALSTNDEEILEKQLFIFEVLAILVMIIIQSGINAKNSEFHAAMGLRCNLKFRAIY